MLFLGSIDGVSDVFCMGWVGVFVAISGGLSFLMGSVGVVILEGGVVGVSVEGEEMGGAVGLFDSGIGDEEGDGGVIWIGVGGLSSSLGSGFVSVCCSFVEGLC